MNINQELKHMCKLCNKSFPCGRSLGGHMRSHIIYPSDQADHQEKLYKKISSVNYGDHNSIINDATGYGVRENPKKTCKFEDLSGDSLIHDKICKECGKGFQSWKALFGHIKHHSDKLTRTRLEEQDSWTSADQSDNETTPSRKKRSSRKVTMYDNNMVNAATTTSSSLSFNAYASSSVSGIEQEQEEVAMCLIMLSKDVSHWNGLNSIGDSSGNNSELVKTTNSLNNRCELDNFKDPRKGKSESKFGPKMNISEMQVGALLLNEKLEKSAVAELSDFQVSKIKMGKILIKKSEYDQEAELSNKKKHNSRKRKSLELVNSDLGSNYSEMYNDKKSKFECASCNKTFHSYQALGGHRASQKKYKGICFDLKIDGSEIKNAGTGKHLSQNQTADKNGPIDQEVIADNSNGRKKINKGVSHECSICFRVFSSGQALGGHKRSHLIAKNNQSASTSSVIDQKPVLEIHDFLDLNLPAPDEDNHTSELEFNAWWIGSNHKHESPFSFLLN